MTDSKFFSVRRLSRPLPGRRNRLIAAASAAQSPGWSLDASPLLGRQAEPVGDAAEASLRRLSRPLMLLAALSFVFWGAGCASTSVGVGVGVGEGGKSVPGSEAGLAEDDSGNFIEEAEAPRKVISPASVRNTHVLKTAFSQVGKPYRYGGTKPETGFDCSGFVKWVYGQYNINLPRRSGDMMGVGNSVARKDLRPGDLVFFGKRKTITHVGIYTGDNKYIHSPSTGKRIQESSLDDRARGEYYAGARRILQNSGASNISDSQKSAWADQAGLRMAVAKASAPSETDRRAQTAAAAKPSDAPDPVKAAAKVKQHKVVAGDTFYKLARKYDVSPELLAKANKIGNYRTAVLRPGQTIFVPGQEAGEKNAIAAASATPSAETQNPPDSREPVVSAALSAEPVFEEPLEVSEPAPAPAAKPKASKHKIENGDTFYGIAKKYGVKASDLAKANNIEDINTAVLKPGKTLAIPSKSSSGGPAAAKTQAQPQAAAVQKTQAQPNNASASSGRRHTIESGDTFYAVAHKYGVKAADLAKANNIEDINAAVLRPGKTLVIPALSSSGGSAAAKRQAEPRRHRVENGDTFYGVAKKYGVKSDELAKVNNIKDIKTAVLRPGQTLLVP